MALVSVLLVCAIHRSMRGWKAAWVLAIIGVASHLLLDWTNAYGIRFFFPFSSRWFHLDLNNLVELWIWAVFLLACLAPLLGRLVSSEMGARPGSGRGLAIFALVFVLGFQLLFEQLLLIQIRVIPAALQQFRVRAFGDQLRRARSRKSGPHCGWSTRDGRSESWCGRASRSPVGKNALLGRRIDARQRVVENQNARIAQHRARNRRPLLLAAGQVMPRSPTMVLRPSGNPSISGPSPAIAAARRISASLASFTPNAIFSPSVALNRNVSCGT
jgi:hypothetical protein